MGVWAARGTSRSARRSRCSARPNIVPDIGRRASRDRTRPRKCADVIAAPHFLLGVDVFGATHRSSLTEERRSRALRTQLDVAREPVRRLVTVLMWTVLLALEAAQVLLCHLHPAAYLALGFSLVALLIQLCAVTFPRRRLQSSPSSETVEALLRQIAHGHRTALPLMLGVIAAEQWGAASGCGAIGALTTLETLAQWQSAGAAATARELEAYENAELTRSSASPARPRSSPSSPPSSGSARAAAAAAAAVAAAASPSTAAARRSPRGGRWSTAPAAATFTTRIRGDDVRPAARQPRRRPLCRRPDAERAAAAGPPPGGGGGAAARPAAAMNGSYAPPPPPADPYAAYAAPSAAYNQYADPSLPPGWEAEVDPMTGQPFYTNVVTGQRLWERPV